MLRSLGLAALFVSSASLAGAAIWPAQLGPHKLMSPAPLDVTANRPVWDEFGLQTVEKADYGQFRTAAYRFKDATGAYAAGQWLSATDSSADTVGNYVVTCAGACPTRRELAGWFQAGSPPQLSRAAYPSLDAYLPKRNLIAGSKRYVIGPQSLALFEPRIPAAAAAFDFNTELQLARYRTAQGEQTLAIASYPTPGLARQQVAIFQKLPDVSVKRTGPLVVAVLGSGGAAAEALLKQVGYAGVVEANETPPVPPLVMKPETAGKMLLAIISLAGLVLGFCVLSGLAFGGMLLVARRFGYSGAEGSLITLHLSGK
jgi:hypothetical protein